MGPLSPVIARRSPEHRSCRVSGWQPPSAGGIGVASGRGVEYVYYALRDGHVHDLDYNRSFHRSAPSRRVGRLEVLLTSNPRTPTRAPFLAQPTLTPKRRVSARSRRRRPENNPIQPRVPPASRSIRCDGSQTPIVVSQTLSETRLSTSQQYLIQP